MFHRSIHAVNVPANVWRCPWQHGLLLHGPNEAHHLRDLTLARGWADTHPESPDCSDRETHSVSSSRRSFPLRVSGDLQAGSFLGWTEGRVCACSHISFHSFTLQKAPDSVKILARSYSQIHFWSWQQYAWVPGVIYSSSLPPTSKPCYQVCHYIFLLSTQTPCFSCFLGFFANDGGSWAKYGDRGCKHILFLLNVLLTVLLPLCFTLTLFLFSL